MEKNNKPNMAVRSLEFQMLLDTLLEEMPLIIEQQAALAKIHKARFDGLIKEGFTEAQALEIVAKRPIAE